MMLRGLVVVSVCALLGLASCGPAVETTKPPVPLTKEALFSEGHQRYVRMDLDGAQGYLEQALTMDSLYIEPVRDLAALHYDLGMREPGGSSGWTMQLRSSARYFARLEAMGVHETEVYERLCEIAVMMNDSPSFVRYAKAYVVRYPYDRQYYNLGVAYVEAGDFQNVIKSQKEAAEKFKDSDYVGSFYRLLGRAYMNVDRDQTAERTFGAGLQAVDARIAAGKKGDKGYTTSAAYTRLMDDKVAMLLALKALHKTYGEADKLKAVEKQLKEAGHNE